MERIKERGDKSMKGEIILIAWVISAVLLFKLPTTFNLFLMTINVIAFIILTFVLLWIWGLEDIFGKACMFIFVLLLTSLVFTITVDYALHTYSNLTTRTHYQIYRVTAPFGVFAVEGQGEIGGLFIVFYGSYSIELTEQYVVKYFDGDELKTKIFDATTVSIVIDETFTLEQIFTEEYRFDRGTGECLEPTDDSRYKETIWRIHLPFLPGINKTTTEWIIP